MSSTSTDVAAADAAYTPFPTFASWSKCSLDGDAWHRVSLGEGVPEETLKKALRIVQRAAAIDSGAIEGLYQVDRGFTFTVAAELSMVESVLAEKGGSRALIEGLMDGYERVLDLATKSVEIAEAWIRELHRTICQSQRTYMVQTATGFQEQELPHGEYKRHPNHVVTTSGQVHSWAPVNETPSEMKRLCDELRSQAFAQAHPVLQATYAHYALVVIHPFSDGNGRTARALASVYTYRAKRIPLLILAEDKDRYLELLALADQGEYQGFIDFVLAQCVNAALIVQESIRAASSPDAGFAGAALGQLYKTKGGYQHHEVDAAAHSLLNQYVEAIHNTIAQNADENLLQYSQRRDAGRYQACRDSARPTVHPPSALHRIELGSRPPAEANVRRLFGVEVPKDTDLDDYVVINDTCGQELFAASVSEVLPKPTSALQFRIRISAERVAGEMIDELKSRAEDGLKKKGY